LDGKINYQDQLALNGVSSHILKRKANTTWQRFLFHSHQIGKFKETSAKQDKVVVTVCFQYTGIDKMISFISQRSSYYTFNASKY